MTYTAACHQGAISCTHLYLNFVNFPFLVHLNRDCFGFLPFPTGSWFWPPPASTPCEPCVFSISWTCTWVILSLRSLCMTVTKCLICLEQQAHDGESLCGLLYLSFRCNNNSGSQAQMAFRMQVFATRGTCGSSGRSPRPPPLLGPFCCGNDITLCDLPKLTWTSLHSWMEGNK